MKNFLTTVFFVLGLTTFLSSALAGSSKECRDFEDILTTRPDDIRINYDQVIVQKGGKTVFEKYRNGVTKNNQHILWSASKSLTALAIAAAIEKGILYSSASGEKSLSLDSPLSDFFAFSELSLPYKKPSQFNAEEAYHNMTIRHLLMMASGLKWAESYSSFLESSFLAILYGDSKDNILKGSLRTNMQYPPQTYFNYSGGNAIMLMHILGESFCYTHPEKCGNSKSQSAMKELLFSPLGITSGFYETDSLGLAVASSYAFMNPIDMLKIGTLLNNQGVWTDDSGKSTRILPKSMVDTMYQQNPVFKGAEIKKGSIQEQHIIEQGHWHGHGWGWKNKDVVNCVTKPEEGQTQGKECLSKRIVMEEEFPHSPEDMTFLAGHFGNAIISLKSEDMVIVMTGQNDDGYWRKLDYFVSKAISCFNNKVSHAPLPKKSTSDISFPKKLSLGVDTLATKLAQTSMAKDICSCVFIHQLGKGTKGRKKLCRDNTPSDGPRNIRNKLLKTKVDYNKKTVSVTFKEPFKFLLTLMGIPVKKLRGIINKKVVAQYFGQENGGCRITTKNGMK